MCGGRVTNTCIHTHAHTHTEGPEIRSVCRGNLIMFPSADMICDGQSSDSGVLSRHTAAWLRTLLVLFHAQVTNIWVQVEPRKPLSYVSFTWLWLSARGLLFWLDTLPALLTCWWIGVWSGAGISGSEESRDLPQCTSCSTGGVLKGQTCSWVVSKFILMLPQEDAVQEFGHDHCVRTEHQKSEMRKSANIHDSIMTSHFMVLFFLKDYPNSLWSFLLIT